MTNDKRKKISMKFNRYHIFLLLLYAASLAWSANQPKEYFTWILEVFPSLIAFMVLVVTYKRFPLTDLAYTLILVHSSILFIGGHYTYAEVPLFDWIRDTFHQSRNNYDKVGHFAQGFIPAIIVREIFIRKNVIPSRSWMNFLIVAVCLAMSAVYEFIEWFVAVNTGESADAFLGTQGYVWDTQSDMLFAMIGAIAALFLLTRLHDGQLLHKNGR
jgi:putative membrane protein